jgi:hypothetical protein
VARFVARARMAAFVAGLVVAELALVGAAGWVVLKYLSGEGLSWLRF